MVYRLEETFLSYLRNSISIRFLIILSVVLTPFTPLTAELGGSAQAKEISGNTANDLIGPFVDDPYLLLKYRMPDGSQPLIEDAIRNKLRDEGSPVTDDIVRETIEIIKRDETERLKLAPFVMVECFNALNTKDRTPVQQAFYKHFQGYFAEQQQDAAARTLRAWEQHKRQWEYDNRNVTGLSVLLETGPTLDDFDPPEDPIDIGPNGQAALQLVFASTLLDEAGEDDVLNDPVFSSPAFKDDVRKAMRSIGLPSTLISVPVIATAKKASTGFLTLLKNQQIRQKELDQLAEQSGKVLQKAASKLAKSSKLFSEIGEALAKFIVQGAGVPLMAAIMAIPALLDSIMAIVSLVKTIKFEEQLEEQVRNPDRNPDIYKMLNENVVREGKLCFEACREGYKGSGFLCLKDCPDGYEEGSGQLLCRKKNVIQKDSYSRRVSSPIRDSYSRGAGTAPVRDSYSRGAGTAPTRDRYNRGRSTASTYNRRTRTRTCPSGKELIAGRCYTTCRSGYRGSGQYCVQTESTCGDKEKAGGLCYTRCRNGYTGSGTRCVAEGDSCGNKERVAGLCYTKCRSGYTGVGMTCRQTTPTCAEGTLSGNSCVENCREGYTTIGNRCRQQGCPEGYTDQGAVCRVTGSNPDVMAKRGYRRGVGQRGECTPIDTRDKNKASIALYLVKMLIADPVDGVKKNDPVLDSDIAPPIPNSSKVYPTGPFGPKAKAFRLEDDLAANLTQ